MGSRRVDRVGQVYGRLSILSLAGITAQRRSRWECLCECGTITQVEDNNLKQGKTVSCGCYNKEKAVTHGMSNTRAGGSLLEKRTYSIWLAMKDRCNNLTNKNYGGRGVTYPDSWEVFENFIEDLGVCPEGYSIERKDVNNSYSKGNCTWIPLAAQAQDKTTTVWVEVGGELLCLAEAIRRLGLNNSAIRARISRGMDPQQAISPELARDLRYK